MITPTPRPVTVPASVAFDCCSQLGRGPPQRPPGRVVDRSSCARDDVVIWHRLWRRPGATLSVSKAPLTPSGD